MTQGPDTYNGINWNGSGEPHINSLVMSHWFFLLTNGGAGTNDNSTAFNVNGLGMASAAEIMYRACTNFIGHADDYNAVRAATILAVQNLHGSNSCEEVAVRNAWLAVGVGAGYTGSFSISGAAAICSSENYTITGLPSGGTATWSVIPSGVVTQGTSGNTLTLTKSTNAPIQLFGQAACGAVTLGSPSRNLASGNSLNGTYSVSSNYHTGSGSIVYGGASFFTRNSQSCLWLLNLDPSLSLSSITWTASGTYNLFYPGSYSASLYMTTPSSTWSSNNASTRIQATGSCGSIDKTFNWQVVAAGLSYRMAASPNPSKGSINIAISQEEDTKDYSQEELRDIYEQSKSKTQDKVTRFALYNFNTNALYKQWKYDEINNMQYRLNTEGMPKGVYVLKMERNGLSTTTKIIVE